MQRIASLAFALTLPATLLSQAAQADEPRYNQVTLRAEVSQEVAHDLMQVTLYSEAQHSDPAQLASQITQTLNSAIQRARKAKGVKVELGSRHSYPVYDDKGQRIRAWRERAELRLESSDFASLSALSGELLGSLQMGGMHFSMADSTRQHSEDAQLKAAVAAFKARATLVTQALGGSDYRLVSLNLNSGYQAPMPRMGAMKAMAMAEAAPTPDIEAGSSKVSVSADGIIEVRLP